MSGKRNKVAGEGSVDKWTVEEFFGRAYEIEIEAEARYLELADQMDVHNNLRVAELFRRFAKEEGQHAAEIAARMKDLGIPVDASQEFDWGGGEGPESVDTLDVHYRMTSYHALELALMAERRAFAFFDQVAGAASDERVKQWAREFADEEAEHVRYIDARLKEEKKPDDDWADDYDPPETQE